MGKIGFAHGEGKQTKEQILFLCITFKRCRQNFQRPCAPKEGNFKRWYFGIGVLHQFWHNLAPVQFVLKKSLHPTVGTTACYYPVSVEFVFSLATQILVYWRLKIFEEFCSWPHPLITPMNMPNSQATVGKQSCYYYITGIMLIWGNMIGYYCTV